MVIHSYRTVDGTEYLLLVVVEKGGYGITTIIIIITKYERTRVLGTRALQIALCAPVMVRTGRRNRSATDCHEGAEAM